MLICLFSNITLFRLFPKEIIFIFFRDTDQQTEHAPRKKVKAFSRNRSNKITPIILSDLSVSVNDTADDVAADIAKNLYEQKPELIGKNTL